LKESGGVDISVLFVPAVGIRDAALDAINAGIKLVVLVADRVPVWDAMAIAKAAKARNANFLGPNTLGIASPGKAVVGMIGGRAQEEELADLIAATRITKPVAAYIGGKAATAGTRFSHAGAIIEGNRGTHAGKVAALRAAGATVVDSFADLPAAVVSILRAQN